jgi:hypothetical protein
VLMGNYQLQRHIRRRPFRMIPCRATILTTVLTYWKIRTA